MMQDTAIVTMEGEYETARKLSNGTSLNDLVRPLTQISRSRYYSTSNKCIGDDTKAGARQSLNCIKNKK